MIIHPEPQGSLEWLAARAGVITASEFNELVDSDFALRKGEMPKTLLARKLAEKWIGPLPGFSSLDMEFGQILEDEAIPFYAFTTGETVQRVGLCTMEDGRIGCSPDGLIGDDKGIEIKCCRAETHLKNLLAGELPKDFAAQVHGGMLVTGRPRWVFMSYHRRLPPLILTIESDEEIQDKLASALSVFLSRLDSAFEKLCELNSGPPQRRKTVATEPVQSEPEYVDVIP